MAYCELDELKAYLGISTTTDDALLESLIASAQKSIDNHCGRWFESKTATRYYESEAVDGCVLYLDADLVSVTTLTNGDDSSTTIPNTEYWLVDRNDGPPYYGIRLEANSDYYWEQDTDYWITVAGEWGYAENPPRPIRHACMRWAGYLYRQKDAQVWDTTAIPEQGVIMVPQGIPRDVKLILDPYRRRS